MQGWRILAVKDNFRLLPSAHAIYACDPHFFEAHRDGVKYLDEMRAHGAEIWTQSGDAAKKHGLNYITGKQDPGLGRDVLHFGGNSGFQAINLAYLWGATTIVLLGFDMKTSPKGASHWFGDHPIGQGFGNPTIFDGWIKNLKTAARDLDDEGVHVFNCSRDTALTFWPRCTIQSLP